MAAGEAMNGMRARACGNTAFVAMSVILTVTGCGVSRDAIRLAWAVREAPFFGSWRRSRLNFTAAASYGVPSVNLLFWRNIRVHTRPSFEVSDSAVWGFTEPPSEYRRTS